MIVRNYPASTANYTPGRSVPITMLVLHTIVGSITTARATFQSSTLANPRSANYGIPWFGARPPELYALSAELVADKCDHHGIPLRRAADLDDAGIIDHRIATATACP